MLVGLLARALSLVAAFCRHKAEAMVQHGRMFFTQKPLRFPRDDTEARGLCFKVHCWIVDATRCRFVHDKYPSRSAQ